MQFDVSLNVSEKIHVNANKHLNDFAIGSWLLNVNRLTSVILTEIRCNLIYS